MHEGHRRSLLARLENSNLWRILDELAHKPELELSKILRPHDEAGFILDPDRTPADQRSSAGALRTDPCLPLTSVLMDQRVRLDNALTNLTLLEIAYETGLLQADEIPASLRSMEMFESLRKLVQNSEAFFRYCSAYLYFGVRFLSFRWYGPNWPSSPQLVNAKGTATNRRLFPLVWPPELVIENAALDDPIFDKFPDPCDSRWAEALAFLDGFHPQADPIVEAFVKEVSPTDRLEEPVQYELWLRGLLPGATQEQAERFGSIRDGLIAWAQSRTAFYLALQKTDFRAAGIALIKAVRLANENETLPNPLTARFALADVYWIARLLRAEVSSTASVRYSRVSWLDLLSFKASLEGKSDQVLRQLKESEAILRAVFDFVCDLVQNGVALTTLRQNRQFNPEDFPAPAEEEAGKKYTKEWRAVFDEELREIDRQRSRRTHTDPNFPPGERFSTNAEDPCDYWSERLITGREPHNRVGIAFSGGGIRSATFNLGVLQGLQEFDILRSVDYLSTVSGGGFIGSWLVGNVQRTRQWLGRATSWDESIAHLRSYSSYLAPLTGILSADTWTLAASWARNAFLIQLTGITWLLALLLGALAARTLFLGLADWYPSVGHGFFKTSTHPAGVALPFVGIVALSMGVIVACTLCYNFDQNRVETGKRSPSAGTIRWLAVLPSWIGAFVIASILWSSAKIWLICPPADLRIIRFLGRAAHALYTASHRSLGRVAYVLYTASLRSLSRCIPVAHRVLDWILYADPQAGIAIKNNPQSLHDFSFIFLRAWQWLFFLLVAHWVALLIIGWFALKPSDSTPALTTSADECSALEAEALKVTPGANLWQRIVKSFKDKIEGAAPVRVRLWRAFWIGTLCSVTLYLALCAILDLYLSWLKDAARAASFADVFGPALVLGAFALSVVLFIGLSGRKSNEAQREWWTRFGAWLLIYATVGLMVSAGAVFSPALSMKIFTSAPGWKKAIPWGTVAGWLGTVIAGLFAGNSNKTAGDGSGKSVALELLAKLGGLLFIIGSVIATASILFFFLENFSDGAPANATYWDTLNHIHIVPLAVVGLVLLILGLLFSWFFEINIFGLSQFYRNRLVRCYLGATRWGPGVRRPHPFTKFDFNDDMPLSDLKDDFRGPFPIFNCTLNLAGSSDLTLHTRHSASFSLTPLRCGSDRPRVGYAPTALTSPASPDSSFAGGVKLGQAVAISGAAASPNMGYNTSPLVALLLTMFNVRLGWWFPNPGRDVWMARGLRFSLYYLSKELLGIADEKRLFVNVSDGGHFENLGVYELVRRRCKVIFASDAECDELLQFGGLGNLVRICATDFGAVIELDVRSIRQQKENHSLAHCAVGEIKYSNGSIGYLIYLKASITGDEDIGIAQYRSVHPSFPHETTANQFFSEDQFESYRNLGLHVVRHCFRGVQPGDNPLAVATKLADVMAPARSSGEAFLKHTRTLDRLWEEFRRSPSLHSFIDELMLVTPPSAAIPLTPTKKQLASEERCVTLQLIQLMEDVFMDLQLDDFWEHPDNRGWAILFMRWARSPRFRKYWDETHRTFGIRFEYFCSARLGLQRDTPIVRV